MGVVPLAKIDRSAERTTTSQQSATPKVRRSRASGSRAASRLAENRVAALRTTPTPTPAAGAALPAIRFSIDCCNDTSDWARDGECDDVRFEGDGMASSVIVQDRGRDAADCRRLYDEGRVRVFSLDLDSGAIDFGDDASDWTQDGECDDGLAPAS